MAMEKKYIITNSGSASRKYALYEKDTQLFSCHIEEEGNGFVATISVKNKEHSIPVSYEDYSESENFLLKLLLSESLIKDKKEVSAIAFRIVAPGEYFYNTKKIDSEYIKKLKEAQKDIPLHISEVLVEIKKFKKLFPDAESIGISDSAFHATLPKHSRVYAIPESMTSIGIQRYGYHGISLSSVLERMYKIFDQLPKRIIVCHLGSGASITALKDGKSFDTSMGFTPLEGLIMATRSGDIDPGAVVEIAREKKLTLEKCESYLNKESGLLGLSGFSSDIRELLKGELSGDTRASFALEMYIYRIKKYIGSYIAALGGIDALIFTATVGERSFVIREKICDELKVFGIVLDKEKNNSIISKEGNIENNSSLIPVVVVPTNEISEMAKETRIILEL